MVCFIRSRRRHCISFNMKFTSLSLKQRINDLAHAQRKTQAARCRGFSMAYYANYATDNRREWLSKRYTEGVNGVNRLATNGKKHYRLPIKREKNYRLPTGKLLTDYRHGPTLSIFFSERRVYCIFSTFLGSNQRYHVTSLFTNIPQNEDIEIGLQSVCQKFLQPS